MSITPPPTAPGQRKVFFSLLNQLRALAAMAVVWSHLVGFHLSQIQQDWWPKVAVDLVVTRPAGIVQDFGWFGVAVFFFISGFVITHAARREPGRVFIVRRVLRIFPPLVFSLLLALAVDYTFGTRPVGPHGALTAWDVIANFTLLNHVVAPTALILTVTWTLAVEMSFYLLMWALLPLLRRWPWVPSAVIIVVSTALVAVPGGFGAFQPGIVGNLPLLVIGQLLYFARMRLVPLWAAVALGAAAWAAYLFGVHRQAPWELDLGANYPSNVVLALGVIVLAVLLEGRIRPNRILDVVAKRSYSLYLVHAVLGLTLLGTLHLTPLPYTVDLLIALIAVAVATEVGYRVAELPGIRLGRKLSSGVQRNRAGRLESRDVVDAGPEPDVAPEPQPAASPPPDHHGGRDSAP